MATETSVAMRFYHFNKVRNTRMVEMDMAQTVSLRELYGTVDNCVELLEQLNLLNWISATDIHRHIHTLGTMHYLINYRQIPREKVLQILQNQNRGQSRHDQNRDQSRTTMKTSSHNHSPFPLILFK